MDGLRYLLAVGVVTLPASPLPAVDDRGPGPLATRWSPRALSVPGLSFASAVRCALLLGLAGASLALLLWALAHYTELLAYSLQNELGRGQRRRLLLLLGGAGIASVIAGTVWAAREREQASARLERLAAQLAPLTLVGVLPFLLHWRIWFERELDFSLFVSGYGLLAYQAFAVSLRAGVGSEGALSRALAGARAQLKRWEGVLPLGLVLAGAAGYAGFFAYHTIAYHHNALTLAWDMAIEHNLIWNLVYGDGELFFKSSPLLGIAGNGSHFGYHATLFAYVIAPLYLLAPRPETLLVFQAVVIGAAALPLFLFARGRIGAYAACLVALAYLLYPPVHGANLYDFHYPPLAVPLLWLTLYAIDSGRYRLAVFAALLTMSVREDMAADLAVMGGFIAIATPRVRAGLLLALVAAVYFVSMKMIIMPRFLDGSEAFLEQWQALVPAGEHGSRAVLMTVAGNPVFTFRSLLEQQKLLYFLQLASPLAFLPWRRPIGFYLMVPGFFFTLLTVGAAPLIQISFQYTAHWTAFLFVGVVMNLEALSRPKDSADTAGLVRKHAWLATLALMTLLTTYQLGAVLQQNTVRGGFGPYKFGTTEEDRERARQLRVLADQIPSLAKLSGSQYTLPQVASRPDAYYLRNGSFDAEYLLFELPPQHNEVRALQQALRGEFGVVEQQGPFVLARRGQPTNANADILRQLR
ncbi:MAG: hypothetical protein RL033_1849 [Pseudomonadota bacterium]